MHWDHDGPGNEDMYLLAFDAEGNVPAGSPTVVAVSAGSAEVPWPSGAVKLGVGDDNGPKAMFLLPGLEWELESGDNPLVDGSDTVHVLVTAVEGDDQVTVSWDFVGDSKANLFWNVVNAANETPFNDQITPVSTGSFELPWVEDYARLWVQLSDGAPAYFHRVPAGTGSGLTNGELPEELEQFTYQLAPLPAATGGRWTTFERLVTEVSPNPSPQLGYGTPTEIIGEIRLLITGSEGQSIIAGDFTHSITAQDISAATDTDGANFTVNIIGEGSYYGGTEISLPAGVSVISGHITTTYAPGTLNSWDYGDGPIPLDVTEVTSPDENDFVTVTWSVGYDVKSSDFSFAAGSSYPPNYSENISLLSGVPAAGTTSIKVRAEDMIIAARQTSGAYHYFSFVAAVPS